MDEKLKNDIFFVCTLIEAVSRKTMNRRRSIAEAMDIAGISHELEYADVNHCLDMEQAIEETIERCHIENGEYDTVSECRYKVPSVTAIGKVYQRLVLAVVNSYSSPAEAVYRVFSSFISDYISDFNSSVYYSSPDYLEVSFKEGRLLEM